MRNSFLSDLLRFASATQSQNFPSSVDGIDCNSNGVADNSSVYHAEKPYFPNLTFLGALHIQSRNRSDISSVGTEIDEYLRRASKMSFEDSPNVDGAVMVNDGDDDLLIPESLKSIQGNDTSTLENGEVLPEAGEPAKVKRRRLSSSAGGQVKGENVTPQEGKLTFGDKFNGMENIIPDSTSEGSDTVIVLEDAAKYIKTLQRKRERADQQIFMYSEELSSKAQNGKFPAFKPVHSKPTSMYPFILSALPHEILSSPTERQGAFRQFTPGTSMCLAPLPDQMPLPDPKPLPDLHEQVQPLPPWEDELQKLVNQTFRWG